MNRRRLLLVSVVLGLVACVNSPPGEVGVWSEFLPADEVQDSLETLAAYDADLYLAVEPATIDASLWALCAEARAAGVGVRLWPQLPERGIWLNEQNIADFAAFTETLIDAAAHEEIAIEWIILDIEPALAYAEMLRAAAASGLPDLIDLLGDHRDRAAFAAAQIQLQALVDALHARGVKVMAVTLPWTVDDLGDGDPDIQDVFDTPLAGPEWDQVCVMVYRPTFSDFFGVDLPPDYVGSYARTARQVFGPNAQVAIGNIGTRGRVLAPGYTSPTDIVRDVAAARAAGLTSISVYSLDGMIASGNPEPWLAAAAGVTPRTFCVDPVTALLRFALRGLDSAADDLGK